MSICSSNHPCSRKTFLQKLPIFQSKFTCKLNKNVLEKLFIASIFFIVVPKIEES